jgi:hypothetical protein
MQLVLQYFQYYIKHLLRRKRVSACKCSNSICHFVVLPVIIARGIIIIIIIIIIITSTEINNLLSKTQQLKFGI